MTMYGTVPASVLRLAGVVDRDDRRVVQRGGVLRLAAEPGLEGRVAGEVGAQHLDRDVPAEPQVAAAVHLGHAAEAERVADLVAIAEQVSRHRRPFIVVALVACVAVPARGVQFDADPLATAAAQCACRGIACRARPHGCRAGTTVPRSLQRRGPSSSTISDQRDRRRQARRLEDHPRAVRPGTRTSTQRGPTSPVRSPRPRRVAADRRRWPGAGSDGRAGSARWPCRTAGTGGRRERRRGRRGAGPGAAGGSCRVAGARYGWHRRAGRTRPPARPGRRRPGGGGGMPAAPGAVGATAWASAAPFGNRSAGSLASMRITSAATGGRHVRRQRRRRRPARAPAPSRRRCRR